MNPVAFLWTHSSFISLSVNGNLATFAYSCTGLINVLSESNLMSDGTSLRRLYEKKSRFSAHDVVMFT